MARWPNPNPQNRNDMPNNTLDEEIRNRIDSFLTELSGLVKQAAIDAVHGALGTDAAPRERRSTGTRRSTNRRTRGTRGPGRPRQARAKSAKSLTARAGRRIRRSAADLEAIGVRVLAHVKANPGHRMEEIGKSMKTDTAVLKRPIANLIARKKLRTEGQKRGTKYFSGGGRGRAGSGGRKAKARTGRKTRGTRRPSRKRAARRSAPAAAPAAAA